jgi:hypothetical protein
LKKSRYLTKRNCCQIIFIFLNKTHTAAQNSLIYHYFTSINNTKNSSTVKCRYISCMLICKHKLIIYIMCLWPSYKIKDIKSNTALDCSIAFLLRIRTNAYVVTVITFNITQCKHLNRYYLPTGKYLKS